MIESRLAISYQSKEHHVLKLNAFSDHSIWFRFLSRVLPDIFLLFSMPIHKRQHDCCGLACLNLIYRRKLDMKCQDAFSLDVCIHVRVKYASQTTSISQNEYKFSSYSLSLSFFLSSSSSSFVHHHYIRLNFSLPICYLNLF